jgi:hypothetical protein
LFTEQPNSSPPSRGAPGSEELDPLSRRLFQIAVVLSVLLLLVLANSFLNDSDGEDPLEFNPVAAAAERTQEEPGARFTMKAVYSSASLPQPMAATGAGSINTESGRSSAVVRINSPQLGPIEIETVSDGTTIYMRGTGFSSGLPDGKEWLAMQPLLGHSEEEAMVGGGDAEGALQMLTAVDRTFQELGRAEVRGVPTRRYRTSVSLSAYAELLRDEDKDELADHYEKVASLMPGPVVGEAWIDGKGILRRNRIVMELPGQSGQPGMTMDMSMDWFDFGASPDIVLPDDDAVFDATPLLEEQFDEIETG